MGQPTNAAETYDAADTSLREDLTSIIEDISPTETPFMSAIGRGKARQTYHEWQTSTLGSPSDANRVAEGDDATLDAAIGTTRVGNYTQISDKTLVVTGTIMAVDHAGIENYKGWQLMKKSQQLKNDMDKQMCSNKASDAGQADAAEGRQSAGFESFIYTNDDDATNDLRGSGGSSPGFSAGVWGPPVDGTQRNLLEDHVKTSLSMVWDEGGDPTMILCGSFLKKVISGFTGGSTRTDKSEDKKLTAAIDYYVGDFNEVRVVPSRHVRTRTVLVVDPSLWALCYLRKFQTWELSRDGDAQKWQLLVEYTLRCDNEAGNAAIADLNDS